jgi:hypothetical protein
MGGCQADFNNDQYSMMWKDCGTIFIVAHTVHAIGASGNVVEVLFAIAKSNRQNVAGRWPATQLPDTSDTVNLDLVRNVVGKSRLAAGAVVCRAPNDFPLANVFRALPMTELR